MPPCLGQESSTPIKDQIEFVNQTRRAAYPYSLVGGCLMTLSKSRACILFAFVGVIPCHRKNSKQAAQDERQKRRSER